jgi:hypothetical protein
MNARFDISIAETRPIALGQFWATAVEPGFVDAPTNLHSADARCWRIPPVHGTNLERSLGGGPGCSTDRRRRSGRGPQGGGRTGRTRIMCSEFRNSCDDKLTEREVWDNVIVMLTVGPAMPLVALLLLLPPRGYAASIGADAAMTGAVPKWAARRARRNGAETWQTMVDDSRSKQNSQCFAALAMTSLRARRSNPAFPPDADGRVFTPDRGVIF